MQIRSHLKCESGVLEVFLIERPKHKCKVITATNCIVGEVSAGANQNVEQKKLLGAREYASHQVKVGF